MKRREVVHDSVPEDVALKIVSCLEVSDVCSLGSCSKFWREVCESDCVWKSFCEERWPGIVLEEKVETPDPDHEKALTLKGWRGLYTKKHNEMVENVKFLRKCLYSSQAITNVKDYLKVVEDMKSMQFGFKDVQMLILKPKISVLLNLAGLHYCIKKLGVQVASVVETLSSCNIQDRQVHVQWWINGGYLHRFRLPDDLYACSISLRDLVTSEEGEEVLGVLEHGVTREVVRAQISPAKCN